MGSNHQLKGKLLLELFDEQPHQNPTKFKNQQMEKLIVGFVGIRIEKFKTVVTKKFEDPGPGRIHRIERSALMIYGLSSCHSATAEL